MEKLILKADFDPVQGFTRDKDPITRILVDGIDDRNDLLVRDLAALALAQGDPTNDRLPSLESKAASAGAGPPSHTTLIVHGTYARRNSWWQPNGDFHSYLTSFLPTLAREPKWSTPYADKDRFDWTGGYSTEKRSEAAKLLLQWVDGHQAQGLDLIAHSYGGCVSMLATKLGVQVRELVLLSCPVLPKVYFPDFGRVGKRVVSFRVHMDLVLILDSYTSGALAKFTDSQIMENVLPLWFDHTLTHRPDVWKNATYNIPGIA